MKEIYFLTKLSEKFGLLVENGDIHDLYMERPNKKEKLDSIYAGKIRNKDTSLQAFFVDIGNEKPGFLPFQNIPQEIKNHYPLTDGSYLPVQIWKEAYQEKGPRLTANITLSNSALVYKPCGGLISSSKKLNKDEVERLVPFFKTILRENEGVIIRSEASLYTELAIQKMLEQLRQQWQDILARMNKVKRPSLLYERALVPDQMMNRYMHHSVDRFLFDDYEDYERMKQYFPSLKEAMEVIKTPRQIAGASIDTWLNKFSTKEVTKKTGVGLTIEVTEALTVIDVDTSTFRTNQPKEITLFKANQKAATYAVQEIRRRNLSGIILIDFLKMTNQKDRASIIKQMKEQLQQDTIQTKIYGFTKLGLLEMTRKRERIGLYDLMKQKQEVAFYQLERELYEYNQQSSVEAVILKMNKTFYEIWQKKDLSSIEKWNKISIYYVIDDTVNNVDFYRVGSEDLIKEWIVENPEVIIDKLI